MLHDKVKQAVDNNDIKALKYEFAGCLDGDPTFEDSIDDFEYCKEHGNFFEPHRELTPMTLDNVDDVYWIQLRNDFMENPSIERLEHMREAAGIFYKERLAVIAAGKAEQEKQAEQEQVIEEPAEEIIEEVEETVAAPVAESAPVNDRPVQQSTEIRRESVPVSEEYTQSSANNGEPSKKAIGVGGLVIAVVLIAIIVVIVNLMNK